jgi:uncharacterized protein YcaQ
MQAGGLTISKRTARRFVLGRQGLWPGRRWAGKEGTAEAIRAIEAVQLDPLQVVARSQDIVLWSRVIDYRPAYLDELVYEDRRFFDYGGSLFVYPMEELPAWRLHMTRRKTSVRWADFAATHPDLLDEMRAAIRERGPLGNRDFAGGERVTSYRGSKDSALAPYYLWLTGELMTHHRVRFERVYDLRERVAPSAFGDEMAEHEAEEFFARKAVAHWGLIPDRSWRGSWADAIWRKVAPAEAAEALARLVAEGTLARVRIEGSKDSWLLRGEDLPALAVIEEGRVPDEWRPLETSTTEEAVLLAPLDIVSARGRAAWLFDFEYIWEVYKPAEKRRWGYYTLPILWGDTLVGRLDPRLDRAMQTLILQGFWLEEHAPAGEAAFAAALARGLVRFADFLGARRIALDPILPGELRERVRGGIEAASTLQVAKS